MRFLFFTLRKFKITRNIVITSQNGNVLYVYCISKLSQRYMFNVQGDKTGHLLDYNITTKTVIPFLSTSITMIALNQQYYNDTKQY